MKPFRWRDLPALTGFWLCLACGVVWAESGVLVVHVKNVHGGSATTLDDGKARIAFAKQTKEKSWISLQILKSPPGKDLVMVSPWDYRAIVPSFENESENFVEVVVVQSGDRAALENGDVVAALVAKVNKQNVLRTGDTETRSDETKANLEAVARKYGYSPEEIDKAIRALGTKTTDSFTVGLTVFYEHDHNKAAAAFRDSLQEIEKKPSRRQKDLAYAAYFLAASLYEGGNYADAVRTYRAVLTDILEFAARVVVTPAQARHRP